MDTLNINSRSVNFLLSSSNTDATSLSSRLLVEAVLITLKIASGYVLKQHGFANFVNITTQRSTNSVNISG